MAIYKLQVKLRHNDMDFIRELKNDDVTTMWRKEGWFSLNKIIYFSLDNNAALLFSIGTLLMIIIASSLDLLIV